MTSSNFSGVDFNNLNKHAEYILEAPREGDEEAIPKNHMYDADDEGIDKDQLHRRICEIREEERRHPGNSIQSWDYTAATTHLHLRIQQIKEEERHLPSRIQQLEEEERQREEEEEEEPERIRQELYNQAIDSEQSNSLSECSDYPPVHPLRLHEPFPRPDHYQGFYRNTGEEFPSQIRKTTFTFFNEKEFEEIAEKNTPMLSKAPRPKTRMERPSLRLDRPPPIIDLSKIFPQNAVSSLVDIQEENNFAGLETMNFEELIFDYEVAPLLEPTCPAEVYRCDVEEPRFFSLEPHWFHDTKKKRCWCRACIQYRETRATGKQLDAHDYTKWCLCSSCMKFWHREWPEDEYCNCQDCVPANRVQTFKEKEAEKKEALENLFAELKEVINKLQSPIQSPSPEQEATGSEERLPESAQKPPSDPPCQDSPTALPEFNEDSFNLFNTIRQFLRLDSDSDSDGSEASFDFDAE